MPPYIAPEKSPLVGFWGKPTSTLDWCEENYVQSRYIAEFCELDASQKRCGGRGYHFRMLSTHKLLEHKFNDLLSVFCVRVGLLSPSSHVVL